MRSFLPRLAAFALGLAIGGAAFAADPPAPFIGKLSLVRYDVPVPFSDGLAPTRRPAQRKDGQDAIEWPDFSLNGQPIFRTSSEEERPLKLHQGAEAASPFQLPTDDVLQPGGHWLRAMEWRRGLRHIYTADGTARCSTASGTMTGRYELWLFPVVIQGEGGPVVKNVELRVGNTVIFKQAGPWRSLTLLLPQSDPKQPYSVVVDGRPAASFQAGLQPIKPGSPREVVIPVSVAIGGEGPQISVHHLLRPAEFPFTKEWTADLANLGKPLPPTLNLDRGKSIRRYLGVEVPVSPLTVYASALPHGESAGFFKKGMDAKAYAEMFAKQGFDTVFDPVTTIPGPNDPESLEKRAIAFAQQGLRLGLQYDHNWTRPSLQHPNLAFFAHTLPDFHAPLYRSISLTAQRFNRFPNFAGISFGANNAGYVPDWWSSPPIPDRPWGEAMIAFTGSAQPKVPRAPSLGPREFPYEEPVKTQAEFTKYVERYDVSYAQFGYFAEAVRTVNPRLTFTTGSFGSAPDNGARGGWPWATIPGRVLAEGLSVQQAYDANELHAAKPLHNVALTDRLVSYFPKKTTWSLLDNHHQLYGREAWQRACVLALTRGIQGLGTNFPAHPEGEGARPEAAAAQAEMNAWMHRYGGVYARNEPEATIGIFFGHLEAVQRKVLTKENASPEELRKGSHEGKVAEALFFCHAAGWPARVITYQELLRGPLPSSIKAILLVGLDQPDATWSWGAGLEGSLQKFLDRGGRILTDDESVCPVPSTTTGMSVAAYVTESNIDPTPVLLARNVENIAKLQAAMQDVPPPPVVTGSANVWAIPTNCADVQYVTVVNQSSATGDDAKVELLPRDPKASRPEPWKTKANASLYVAPITQTVQWHTDRPIYDVRLQRKLTPEEAAEVDLTKDGFRWYALPPAEIAKPELTVDKGVSGFFEARVKIPGAQRMDGLPVQLTVTGGPESATVYSTTGLSVRLPLRDTDDGDYTVTATELITGLAETTKVSIHAESTVSPRVPVQMREPAAIAKFAARKRLPLTIALTPDQEKDVSFPAQARTLKAWYEKQGRVVLISSAKPGGIIEGLQPLASPHRFPQWKTVATDLILFGTPANNLLMLDQTRGEIFPRYFTAPTNGEAALIYTRSPFVGESDVLNIVASDTPGFAAAVQKITTLAKP